MSNLIRFTGKQCDGQLSLVVDVDDTLSAITSGDTLYITDIQTPTKKFCVVAGAIIRGNPPTHTFVEYSDCSECLIDNNDYVIVESCYNSNFTYAISVFDLPTGSTIGDSIYISLTPPGSVRDYTDCFTIKSFGVFNDQITIDDLSVINSISPTTYTGCSECYQSNNLVYEVVECLTSVSYYVFLPGTLEGHIITFVSGVDQFCGVVGSVTTTEYTATFVADLGVFEGDRQCQDCQEIVSDKRIITNCSTGDVEVAWASLFFDYGDASNLSIDGSCYLVGDLTESGVTITTDFLNYDVTPDCESCIQCNGVVYEYSTCDATGPVTNFTYTATTSTLTDGDYYSVTGTTDGSGGYSLFYINVSGGLVSIVNTQSGGYGYNIGDLITLSGTDFGGIEEDIIEITVTEVVSTGYIYSYYYYDGIINTTFYNPTLNNCCEIKGIGGGSPNQYFYSFNTYDGCTDCENNDYYFVWVAEVCLTQETIVVVTPVGFGQVDIVKLKYGTSDYFCATLTDVYDPLQHYYITNIFKTDDVISYSDCETCDATTTINLSVKECDTSINSYVSFPLNIWYEYVYNLSLNTYTLNQYDKCSTILNTCPLPGDYPTVTPYAFYLNCETCTFDNTRFPRNAGPETLLCIEVCGPSGTTVTQVSPPHPVWTDAYGTAVTQLNMITLGGPDGLNS
jgi:hypothetical protein